VIKTVEIKNFKSIDRIVLQCKKINVFIGEPNTGKSNILEALGLYTYMAVDDNEKRRIGAFFRGEKLMFLFKNNDKGKTISVKCDDKDLTFNYDAHTKLYILRLKEEKPFYSEEIYCVELEEEGIVRQATTPLPNYLIKFYRYIPRSVFPREETDFLLPIDGDNMLAIIKNDKKIQEFVKDVLEKFNLKMVLRPHEYLIEIHPKTQKEEIITEYYPYSLLSDTLQRYIFISIAILSNKQSVLLFEEPEAHAFPYYTKQISELIANDENNQFFITTHNPLFLMRLLEKSKKSDINVFLTFIEKGSTKVKVLSEKEKEKILDESFSFFFNLNKLIL